MSVFFSGTPLQRWGIWLSNHASQFPQGDLPSLPMVYRNSVLKRSPSFGRSRSKADSVNRKHLHINLNQSVFVRDVRAVREAVRTISGRSFFHNCKNAGLWRKISSQKSKTQLKVENFQPFECADPHCKYDFKQSAPDCPVCPVCPVSPAAKWNCIYKLESGSDSVQIRPWKLQNS